MTPDRDVFLSLLTRLLVTSAPSGHEDELDGILLDEIVSLGQAGEVDAAGNIVVRLPGESPEVLCLAAHKDEVGMIVKRVESDGTIHVEPLGGCLPWKLGEGPVEILTATHGPVDAVLSVGCTHTSEETTAVHKAKTQPLTWNQVHLETKRSAPDLASLGVHPGCRVAVHRRRKEPLFLGDFVCSYGLDDKGALAILLTVLKTVCEQNAPPPKTLILAATSEEEQAAAGGGFLLRQTDAHTLIALEVGPVEREYATCNDQRPILWYKDAAHTYSRKLSDELYALADSLGFGAQRACYSSAGTDASLARKHGWAGAIACVGFPTDNTHGYEIANVAGMLNTAHLLSAYILNRKS